MNNTSKFDHFYELKCNCSVNCAKIENPCGMDCPHHHDDYEIYFLISGNRKYFIQDKIYTLQPNQIVIFKPNMPHQVTVNLNIPYERLLLYVTPHLFNDIINQNSSLKNVINVPLFNLTESDFKTALHYIDIINQEYEKDDIFSSDIIKNAIAQVLFFICRYNDTSNITVDKIDFRIQTAIDFIIENYAEPITLIQTADVACMSQSHFSRVFHKTTSYSFKEYLNKIRVDKACELLKNSKHSIADIAQLVGFNTESYFSYIFKCIKNISPTHYRTKKQEKSDKQ